MTAPIRVLHVDDDPDFTDLTIDFFDQADRRFDVVTAADAEEGLELLDSGPIDCVVSDYRLPGADGIEFLKRVREAHPELPFVLFTGRGSEQVASEAISAGATDYFPKANLEDQYELLANRIENLVTATADRRRVSDQRHEYRTLLDEAPIPMLVVDQSATIQYANARAIEVFGARDDDEFLGTGVEQLLPESEREVTEERLERVLTDRESVDVAEYEFLDLDGNIRYGRGTIVPVTFDSDPAAQVAISDITERKRHETRAQLQREQIAKLHDVGVELASCESPDAVYELMVDAAESILDIDLCIVDSVDDGYLTVEATSSDLTEYEEAPIEEGGIAGKAYRTGKSYHIDHTSDHPEADPVDEYRSSLTVPIGDFGVFQAAAYEARAFDEVDLELVEILAGHVHEALTRLEQQEKLREQRDKLRRENERLDEFASIVSHDLRNPLNVAKLRLDLARDECDSEHLEVVERAVDRMETLTTELLALARVGESVTEFESVNLGTVTDGCWHNVETADATLAIEADTVVRADSNRIQQLFENLFRNAVTHGGDDVTVGVGLLDGGDGFYVEDDGVGMSKDVRERAFESGFSTAENGTGFGLAIVARVAQVHDWDVTVTESEAGGARFEFTGVDVVD